MHLTDHLTDEQLNEFLDDETKERETIESHLTICADCAARLTVLQALFAEIESLPELTLSHDLAVRVVSIPGRITYLPRWLTLTATLQAAFALITLILAAPSVMNLLPAIETPSFTEIFLQLQSQWVAWLDFLTAFELPTLPEIPAFGISSLALSLSLAGASLLWLVGNGLLLRNQNR